MSLQLRFIFIVAAISMVCGYGYADTSTTHPLHRPKRIASKRKAARHRPPNPNATFTPKNDPLPATGSQMMSIAANDVPLSPVAASAPALSLKTAPTSQVEPLRLLNIRLHPIYLFTTLTQPDTVAEFRADIDFIAGERFTIGPSVAYHYTSSIDTGASSFQTVDLKRLELGLLSNIYLFGTSREGGLALRPHLYYIDVTGDKENDQDAMVATGDATNGWRTGAELVYQRILPMGLNFEIGGGFTYYFVPYSVNYSDNTGMRQSTPDNRLAPTITAGIGWAF